VPVESSRKNIERIAMRLDERIQLRTNAARHRRTAEFGIWPGDTRSDRIEERVVPALRKRVHFGVTIREEPFSQSPGRFNRPLIGIGPEICTVCVFATACGEELAGGEILAIKLSHHLHQYPAAIREISGRNL